jgi:hypothetical protein
MQLNPTDKVGRQIQIIIRKVRRHLFVFVTNRDLEATNNGSERALRLSSTPTFAPSSKPHDDALSAPSTLSA